MFIHYVGGIKGEDFCCVWKQEVFADGRLKGAPQRKGPKFGSKAEALLYAKQKGFELHEPKNRR